MIIVKWSKTALGDPATLARLQQPMAIAKATANHIRQRVAAQGRTATPAEPYSGSATAGKGKNRHYYLSPAYAERLGLGNQTRWESSRAMHTAKGLTPGKASATGGMWAGLQVRNFGGTAAVIDFGGSSLGASSTRTAITRAKHGTYEVTLSADGKLAARQARELTRDEGGAVKYRRKPRMIKNSTKAGTVFSNTRVGLLQNTEAEAQAMAAAVATKAGSLVAACFGARNATATPGGDRALYWAILQEMK